MSKKNFFAGRRIVEIGFREQVKQTKKKGPQDRNKRDRNRKDEPEFRKVFRPVWIQSSAGWPKSKYYDHVPLGLEEDPMEFKAKIFADRQANINPSKKFNWPQYNTDYKRIKGISRKFKNQSIVDAFNNVYDYNVSFSQDIADIINSAPTELRVGDVVSMPIRSVTKDGVLFNTLNYKQVVNCNTNLYKFEKFKNCSFSSEPIKVKVISADHNRVTVDLLTPMLDEWMNPILADVSVQRCMSGAKTIKVKDLKLTRGGFVGKAVIPSISKYVGEDYTIEAFIPGSQIVLNAESDFNKWEGKTVDAFIMSYIPKPNAVNQMSLICSVKEYLKFEGDQKLIDIFNHWCDGDKEWENISTTTYPGIVTGVIQSSKKCGAFVEIPELNITGFVTLKADQLGSYPPNTNVKVKFVGVEEPSYYDDTYEQLRHDEPYTIEGGVLKECNIKPILQFAE